MSVKLTKQTVTNTNGWPSLNVFAFVYDVNHLVKLFLFSFIKGREVSGNVFACEGACVCVGEKEKKRVR